MATPSIGAVSFMALRGRVTPQGDESEDVSRKGLDGHELYVVGSRGARGDLMTMRDFDSVADATAHITSCLALKGGALRTITYTDGSTTTNVAILDVGVVGGISYSPAAVGGLTDGSYLVMLRWTVMQAE